MLSIDEGSISAKTPLVVNVEGALLKSSVADEKVLNILRRYLGQDVDSDELERLLLREEVTNWLEREHAAGRRIVLLADELQLAKAISARLAFVDEIVVTGSETNPAGLTTADLLRARFPQGFAYAGHSATDLPVWQYASQTVLVGASASLERSVRKIGEPYAVLSRSPATFRIFYRALRIHQWVKNLLVFIPLMLGGKFYEISAWSNACVAFLALGMLASSTYLINDLWDIREDRRHWSKRARPLAAGEFSVSTALVLSSIGAVTGLGLGVWLGGSAIIVLGLYLLLALAYSFRLKREPIIDVLVLASLFTMRLGVGLAVTQVRFSSWLFVFSMFVFLSLSLAKRCTEITRLAQHGETHSFGRGYAQSDEPLVLAMGVASMFGSALILIIYLITDAFPAGFYGHPAFLWVFPVVLFMWLARIWLLCHRGMLHDDPVVFALNDSLSLGYGALLVLAFVAAVV
jgi:4-hydroxybenzoate polyprenyltransferase